MKGDNMVNCPNCQAEIEVNSQSDDNRYECPECHEELLVTIEVSVALAGHLV